LANRLICRAGIGFSSTEYIIIRANTDIVYPEWIYYHINSTEFINQEKGFTRDMTEIGHYGTGNLQVSIKSIEDFEKAKPLNNRAYNEG